MALAERLCSSILAEVHEVIENLLAEAAAARPAAGASRLLDVGCWDGAATLRYARRIGAQPAGIEIFERPATEAAASGVEVARADLESEVFPWPDASFDYAIANQVLEHLKNIWLPMAEIYRVLKPGGVVVASVPNLASLHNRVLLALGMQPTSIRILGPHVRGFTRAEFERFVGLGDALTLERSVGAGFLPLSPPWTRPLSYLWPGASHTVVVVARKKGEHPDPWRTYLEGESEAGVQTHYRRARSFVANRNASN